MCEYRYDLYFNVMNLPAHHHQRLPYPNPAPGVDQSLGWVVQWVRPYLDGLVWAVDGVVIQHPMVDHPTPLRVHHNFERLGSQALLNLSIQHS